MEAKGIYGGPVIGNSGSVVFSNSLVLNKLVELPVTDFKCFGKWGKRFSGIGSTTNIVHMCGKIK